MADAVDTEMDLSDGEQTNAVRHVTVSPSSVATYNRIGLVSVYGNSHLGKEKGIERENYEQKLPGYIFMCNARTKTDCFRYRVFGIPKGRKQIVENIKPGMKLFLYDFEKRLLYGVYEATISGKLNIEPEAFEKKYPAQVGFRIVKNCYPLPEITFKPAIYENYSGSKFKQELAPHQVMSLLSLFRPLNAPELDSLPHRMGSRAGAPRALSFEERLIAATQLRHASSVLDQTELRRSSLMEHQSAARAPLTQHNYPPRSVDYTNPQREALSLSSLSQLYCPTETRLGDPSRSSIQDPQLKYLTILSNIRRYGSDPDRSASENEYNPTTSSEKDHFPSPYSDNRYYPSTLSGNQHASASAATGSVYGSEYYTSASQKEGQAGQQLETTPSGTYYHQETSTLSNPTDSMQSDVQAANAAQSHQPAAYPTQAQGEATGHTQQQAAEAISYTQQPYSLAATYSTHSQPESVEETVQSYAGTVNYTQQATMGQTTQLYAGATGYTYTPQHSAAATGYTPQYQTAATGYAPQPQAAATGYAPTQTATTVYAPTQAAATGYAPTQAAATGYAPQAQAAATGYAPQAQAAATGYASQAYAQAAAGYMPQYYVQAVGYTPQIHAQTAVGYTQQPMETQPPAPGTTTTPVEWNIANQSYSATGDWTVANQSYYYQQTAAPTTTYNQTT